MTTVTSTLVRQSANTVGFRAWTQDFHNMMLAMGMLAASDTGQMDFTTVIYAASSIRGYRVYKTNDGFADIYLIVQFGTYNNPQPRIIVQACTATNGAGVASGMFTAAMSSFDSSSNSPTNTDPCVARACGIPGCYWIEYADGWGRASGSSLPTSNCSAGTIILSRFCGTNGIPNSNGFVLMFSGGQLGSTSNAGYAQQINVTAGVISAVGQTHLSGGCLIPFAAGSGVTNEGDIQVWQHFTGQPRAVANPFVLTRNAAAVGTGVEKSMVVSGQTRNYISIGVNSFQFPGVGSSLAHSLMLPWM